MRNEVKSTTAKNSNRSASNRITLREFIAGIGIMGILGTSAIIENFGLFATILYLAACSILIYIGGAFHFQAKSNR